MDEDELPPIGMTSRERRERRNARERQTVQRRKRSLEQMRVIAAKLEQEKRVLEERYGQQELQAEQTQASQSTGAEEEMKEDPFQKAQSRYFQVLKQVEQLRLENRLLTEELVKHDLFKNAVGDIVDQFPPIVDQYPPNVQQGVDGTPDYPVSMQDAHALVNAVYTHLDQVHHRMSMSVNPTEVELFGWSDCRCQVGEFVDFAVKKNFYHQSAEALCLKTWRLFGTQENATKMMPAFKRAGCPRMLRQLIDFNTLVIHGAGSGAANEIARSSPDLLMARATRNGSWMLLMCYFDAQHVSDRKPLERCFSWYYEDLPGDEFGVPCTRVQVGGSVVNASERMVRAMISEHVFIMVRWENLAINQRCLVWS